MKIIGFILVILSSSYTGFYLANRQVKYKNQLEEFKKALIILKGEIEFSSTNLTNAFLSISERVKKPVSNIFLQLHNKMVDKLVNNLQDMWTMVFKDNEKTLYFDEEDLQWFDSFSKTLGYLDKNMQLNSITLTTDYIDRKVKLLSEKNAVNGKLYKSLGILFGVLIAVLFI